jgi:hypothetical protein
MLTVCVFTRCPLECLVFLLAYMAIVSYLNVSLLPIICLEAISVTLQGLDDIRKIKTLFNAEIPGNTCGNDGFEFGETRY